ncbi:DUF397 domain-containing protein [Streptomyces sp. NPDC015131]|uniref:DUF397 domain-containing protein n=1 Tax=Streptomyces sp. NPDC015131 TaxID=3364941 RepID=UPI0036F4EF4A
MLIRHDMLTDWTKSSYSAVNGDCVEVKARDRRTIAVRDSKDTGRRGLSFSAEKWAAFVDDVSEGSTPGA